MAVYKVIQDIEAEDKLLGPLTMRQFIYAAIAAVSGFLTFRLMFVSPFLAIPFIPPLIVFGILAAPFGKDQPTEVWLLAKIRFALKPHKRLWNQSGVLDLVTVTAPKRDERVLTDNLSPYEVKSRLKGLANTLDSRGWAVKNMNVSLGGGGYAINESDRLIQPSSLPQDVPTIGGDIVPADDMWDDQNNPVAQQLSQMIAVSGEEHRKLAVSKMQQASKGQDTPAKKEWFARKDENEPILPKPQTRSQSEAAQEKALLEKLRKRTQRANNDGVAFNHMKIVQPIDPSHRVPDGTQKTTEKSQAKAEMTGAPQPAILELANNDDLNIATIARQANKAQAKQTGDDEVVISLH